MKMLVAFQPWKENCGGAKLHSQGFNLKRSVRPPLRATHKRHNMFSQEGRTAEDGGGSCHSAEPALESLEGTGPDGE